MRRTKLPISALPAWCKLNDLTFLDTAVTEIAGKGFGLVTERRLSSQDTFDTPTLLLVPNDLVLSTSAIEEHAKVDHHFRQLLDAAGGKVCSRSVLEVEMRADLCAVFEGRCFAVPAYAGHDWILGAWAKCWLVESLDRVCEDASRLYPGAYDVE
jgi:hypothetical protein